VKPARGDAVFGALLFVLALAPRLYVALAWAGEAVWDGHYYDFGARRIALGLGYSDDLAIGGRLVWHPWAHYPVGYSGLLALFYRVFGTGIAMAALANALVGAALAVVTWALARHAMSSGRARVAGLVVALHPGLVLYAALVMSEPLAALLTLLAFLVAVRDRPLRGLALGALLLGVAALVRPQALLCAPFLVLVGVRELWKTTGLPALALVALAGALALLPVLPWTARNCARMDGCALVSTNAGWNLAIGAFPRATGRFETLRASDGCPIVTGQVQQDRCWLQEGVGWIAKSPRRWLGLMPDKLSFTFDHESFPMGYLGEADPATWPEERKAMGRELLSTFHRALLALAALGVVASPFGRRSSARGRAVRDRLVQGALGVAVLGLAARALFSDFHPAWPLAVAMPVIALLPLPGRPSNGGAVGYLAFAVASVAATHAVFFGEDRYHMVITPALCILAACALRRADEQPAAPPVST
jgi:4-amino-4-deoxy-L-arabinose transferase-like glycosyltransferase